MDTEQSPADPRAAGQVDFRHLRRTEGNLRDLARIAIGVEVDSDWGVLPSGQSQETGVQVVEENHLFGIERLAREGLPREICAATGKVGVPSQTVEAGTPGNFARGFPIADALPARRRAAVRAWDIASTPLSATGHDPDWTAGVLICTFVDDPYFYIVNVRRTRSSPAEVDRFILQTASEDGQRVRVREEQEPGASGKAIISHRTRLLAGFDFRAMSPTGDKESRWRPLAAQAEAGNVRMLRDANGGQGWNREFLDELTSIPFGAHDDQADAAAYAFNEVARGTREFGIDNFFSPK